MKKTSILVVAVIAAGLASCTAQSPKATLKTEIDSLSYALGIAQTQGLSQYLTGRLGLAPGQMDDFIRGVADGAKKTSKEDIAYMEGLRIGQQMGSQESLSGLNRELFGEDSTQTVNVGNIIAGFIAGAKNDTTFMKPEEASAFFQTKMEEIKAQTMEKKFGDNRETGAKFLEENKTKEGIITTESGLQYRIITQGKGAIPTETDRVKVNYRGTLIDGTEFDSSFKRNEPATFGTTQVIKGWTEALLMMPVGSKWELFIPEHLAYGSRDTGNIPPFSTLIFEVELVDIVK